MLCRTTSSRMVDVTPAHLNYLYQLGTRAMGLDAAHPACRRAGNWAIRITSPLANDGCGVNLGFGIATITILASRFRRAKRVCCRASAVRWRRSITFLSSRRNSSSCSRRLQDNRAREAAVRYPNKSRYLPRGLQHRGVTIPTSSSAIRARSGIIGLPRLVRKADVRAGLSVRPDCSTRPDRLVSPRWAATRAPPIAYTLLQCERTGVTAAQYNQRSIPQGSGVAAVAGKRAAMRRSSPNMATPTRSA